MASRVLEGIHRSIFVAITSVLFYTTSFQKRHGFTNPPLNPKVVIDASFANVAAVNIQSPIFGFSIKLHNGGVFTISPNRKYNNGNINFVDMIDSEQFFVHEIDSMLEDLGQDGHRVMFYHFLKPGCDLDNGLEPLACDKDVVLLGNYVTQGPKLVEVFVEHEKTNPDIYTTPKSKRLLIEELDDAEPIISKAGITPVAKKLVLDVNNKKISGKDLEGQSSGKELEGQRSGKDLEGQSSAVGNDGSSQVPKGDEERHSEEETEVEDESDSEDSDYLVDEDNNVD
ncbi:hypothetical protein Tco_1287288, partial [Tanacetum coccineum]